jgi:tyrosinase
VKCQLKSPQMVRLKIYACLNELTSIDPIFFVHHTQIDRLWWQWQKENPEVRFSEYGGYQPEAGVNSTHNFAASPHDVLQMFGMGKDLIVGKMLRTKSEFMCYEYSEHTS